MSETLQTRVQQLVDRTGKSAAKLTREHGFGRTLIYDILSGKTKKVSGPTALKLAEALRTTPEALLRLGEGELSTTQNRVVSIVGYVGAGARIYPIDTEGGDQVLDEVELDFPMPDGTVAAIVRGDSMLPVFEDGDLIGYYRQALDPQTILGRTCVVKVTDGPMYVKTLKRGSDAGLFTLTSFNATDIEDVAIEWAAPFQFRVSRFQWRPR